MKKSVLFKIFLGLDIIIIVTLLIINFVPSIKKSIITKSINSKSNKWLAYTLYSDKAISGVLAENNFTGIDKNIDLKNIVVDNIERKVYENEFDEAILTRDPGNENYKLLNIEVGGYKAYLVAIYNPSKVELIHSKAFNTGSGQEKVKDMCSRLGGIVCVNGGMFVDNGTGSDIPMGYLIKDGKIIWQDNSDSASLIGFTKDHKLLLVNTTGENAIKMGMRDALEFGPFLIVNGKRVNSQSNVGGFNRAARVTIAQRKDGIVLFLVTEGTHSNGPDMNELTDTLENYGAYNAANLDGGASSQLAINGELINNPKNIYGQNIIGGRSVVSGFGLIP